MQLYISEFRIKGMDKKFYKNSHYIVYSDGRIWSEYNNCFLNKIDNGIGYMHIGMSFGEKGNRIKKKVYVHRIVAETFINNPFNLPQVNHKNGIKSDNRVGNLEWCNRKYNIRHGVINGLIMSGSKHIRSKLSVADVNLIRASNLRPCQLSKMYSVADTTICSVISRKTYKYQ